MDPTFAMLQGAQAVAIASIADQINKQNQAAADRLIIEELEKEVNKVHFDFNLGGKALFEFTPQAWNLEIAVKGKKLVIKDTESKKLLSIVYSSEDYAKVEEEKIYAGASYSPDPAHVETVKFCGKDYSELIKGYLEEVAYEEALSNIPNFKIHKQIPKFSEKEIEDYYNARRKEMIERKVAWLYAIAVISGIASFVAVCFFVVNLLLAIILGSVLAAACIGSAVVEHIAKKKLPLSAAQKRSLEQDMAKKRNETLDTIIENPECKFVKEELDKKYFKRHIYLEWRSK